MDAVYILGSGSLSKNEELRMSIRSLQKHMVDLDRIFVIGEYPGEWFTGIHIHMEDLHTEKWKNAYIKTLRACDSIDISDEFLLMNDDFFMNADFVGAEFPFYTIPGANGGSSGMNYFGIHCPIRIKKDWYKAMPFSVNMKGEMSPRSFYANFYRAPVKKGIDTIVVTGGNCPPFDFQVADRDFFSIGNNIMTMPIFYEWLYKKYPLKSRFEK